MAGDEMSAEAKPSGIEMTHIWIDFPMALRKELAIQAAEHRMDPDEYASLIFVRAILQRGEK